MSGRLTVVGLGPGDARWLTPEAKVALAEAEMLYGYWGYLDRVPPRAGQSRLAENRTRPSPEDPSHDRSARRPPP